MVTERDIGPQVLIISNQRAVQVAAGQALAARGFAVSAAFTGVAALQQATMNPPRLIVLDLALPDTNGFSLCRRLRISAPNAKTAIVVIGAVDDPVARERCFDCGADEVMVGPLDAEQLMARVNALLGLTGVGRLEPPRARIVSFFGAKGGSGTTTICVNAAAAMAARRADVVVADLVLPIGSVDTFLELDAPRTIADLAEEGIEIDEPTVATHLATRRALGFRVLPGAPNPVESQKITPAGVGQIVHALAGLADYLFIDIGRALSRIVLPLLLNSDKVVVIATGNKAALKLTRVCLAHFAELGIDEDNIVLVLNRADSREDITRSRAEDFLGRPIPHLIPHEADKFSRALTHGVPMVQQERYSTAAAVFDELASALR